MENLRLFTTTYCPFCERVKKFMEENSITGVEVINIDKDPAMKDYLLEKGGKKQVPCLFVGEEPMYESQDILDYLEKNCK